MSSSDLIRLSEQAASLSSDLYTIQEKSQHETTSEEITSIADELSRLSTTLWHLHVAINADPQQYTDAFQEDLAEITNELSSVFEEISECCVGLAMADSSMSAVSWFFKKGRVGRLLKHLEAMKGTCVVMRTVLWHGKSYGTHTSDRCAESSPHTMQEDRVILESVLAQNRDAILDLHNLTNTWSNDKGKQIERTSAKAGDHHRELSKSTGVDVPPIADVLPPSNNECKAKDGGVNQSILDRTFSKRGVRLGIHMSILDLGAPEAPVSLKQKWVQQAHLRQQLVQSGKHGLTALSELSRISEVDTTASSSANLHQNQVETVVEVIPESPHSPERTHTTPMSTSVAGGSNDTLLTPNLQTDHHGKVSSKLRRAFSRISLNSLYSPQKSAENLPSQPTSMTPATVSRMQNVKSLDTDRIEGSPSKQATLWGKQIHEYKPRCRPFSNVLKGKFAKSQSTAEQFDKEYRHT